MGFFDSLFGKKPAPAQPSAEELAAKEAKAVDNMLWSAREDVKSFVPWIVERYNVGAVPEFDRANVQLERQRIEDAAEQAILDGYRKMRPHAGPALNEVREEAVQQVFQALAIKP